MHVGTSPWQKSKAGLGNIGPVERPRVTDLTPIDQDRPLNASQRAMQKGIPGCCQILEHCFDGVAAANGKLEHAIVFEFCVNRPWSNHSISIPTHCFARFNEWGQAVWQKQKKLLDGTSASPQWYFEGFLVEHPDADPRDFIGGRIQTHMQGKMMTVPRLQRC